MPVLGTAAGPNLYSLSVTNAALLAGVPANATRQGVTIQNNSANVITFTFGATAPVSQSVGVQIPANSNINVPASGLGTVGNIGAQINFIGSAAGPSAVTVIEYY